MKPNNKPKNLIQNIYNVGAKCNVTHDTLKNWNGNDKPKRVKHQCKCGGVEFKMPRTLKLFINGRWITDKAAIREYLESQIDNICTCKDFERAKQEVIRERQERGAMFRELADALGIKNRREYRAMRKNLAQGEAV